MPRRREFPHAHIPVEHNGQWFGPLPERPNLEPKTAIQSLMESVGKGEPAESLEERQPLIAAIQRAVERLDEPDRSMIEAYFYEGVGHRGVERRSGVSKSKSQRDMPEVVNRLRELLLEEPLVRARLGYIQE